MKLNLPQTATYWAPGAYNDYGKRAFSEPVQLDCRWQDVAQLYRDAEGVERTSSSVVYFSQDVAREGWLFLGTSAEVDPKNVTEAHEIQQVADSPNLRATQFLYKAYL